MSLSPHSGAHQASFYKELYRPKNTFLHPSFHLKYSLLRILIQLMFIRGLRPIQQFSLLKYSKDLQRAYNKEDKPLAYAMFLPKDWNEQKLKQYFEKYTTKIEQIKLVKDSSALNTGRALIEFSSKADCTDFVTNFSNHYIDTPGVLQGIVVKQFGLKKNASKPEILRSKRQAYITGLPLEMQPEDLMDMLVDFGEIKNVQLPKDADGKKNKGYAFVLFAKAQDADKFMTFMNGKNFLGKKLSIQLEHFRFDTQKPNFAQNPQIAEDEAQYKQNKVNYKSLQKLFEI